MIQTQSSPIHPPQPIPAQASFSHLHLAEPLMRGLAKSGFGQPTEIQARALPAGLEGRDVLASAQTGTGKTAAFVLPALQRLLRPARGAGRGPRALILTPTRELAGQVESVLRQLGQFTRLSFGCIVGGMPYPPQERLLRNPLDILVATPGRLIDHMDAKLVDFSRLELLVLDEADRMLDMGFIKPVRQIAAALPTDRQTLLFSATVEGAVQDIARRLLRNPVEIRLATATQRHESIAQSQQTAESPEHKHALLARLLDDPALTQAIVFTGTKRGADKLAKRLKLQGHNAAALHGNMRQSARKRTLDSLRSGQVRILVATDVAARGIDLLGVSHVINFDLPMVAEDYIHRVGRTGRNGASGIAISLVGHQDRVKLANIERLIGRRLVRENVVGLVVPAAPPHGKLVSAAPSRGASEPQLRGRLVSPAAAHRSSSASQAPQRGRLVSPATARSSTELPQRGRLVSPAPARPASLGRQRGRVLVSPPPSLGQNPASSRRSGRPGPGRQSHGAKRG